MGLDRMASKDRSATAGNLVYAVGDIHGRLDAMYLLLGKILADARRQASPDPPLLIFLGDYVDRGSRSREVVDALTRLERVKTFKVSALKGNHEDALLRFLEDAGSGPQWASWGGRATLASYGVTPPRLNTDVAGWARARDEFADRLPDAHLVFLRSLKTMQIVGDFAFVHAGVRPGVALIAQTDEDLLWIREPFLSHNAPYEKVIVHGHTPGHEPSNGPYRIGVDTGAYASGLLTAVRLEGIARSFLQASVPSEQL